MLFTTRAEATWLVLLPLKRLLASTPFSRNVLLVSRCPLAQMGSIAEAAIEPVPLEVRVDAGRKNCHAGEAAGGKRHCFELRFIQHVAVGGIHGVEQGSFLDGDGGAD